MFQFISNVCKFLRYHLIKFDTNYYNEECPICLEVFSELDDYCELCTLKCGHSFHVKCLADWLHKESSCPSCRRKIAFKLYGLSW